MALNDNTDMVNDDSAEYTNSIITTYGHKNVGNQGRRGA